MFCEHYVIGIIYLWMHLLEQVVWDLKDLFWLLVGQVNYKLGDNIARCALSVFYVFTSCETRVHCIVAGKLVPI